MNSAEDQTNPSQSGSYDSVRQHFSTQVSHTCKRLVKTLLIRDLSCCFEKTTMALGTGNILMTRSRSLSINLPWAAQQTSAMSTGICYQSLTFTTVNLFY
jgi:hypothetical protein